MSLKILQVFNWNSLPELNACMFQSAGQLNFPNFAKFTFLEKPVRKLTNCNLEHKFFVSFLLPSLRQKMYKICPATRIMSMVNTAAVSV